MMMGKIEAKLEGYTDWVFSVAFSQDGSQVVFELYYYESYL